MKQILVIIHARIGDTLLVTPVLRAIKTRYPQCTLTVMAHPKRKAVLEHLAFIDHLCCSPGKWACTLVRVFSFFYRKVYDAALIYGRDRHLVEYALARSRQVIAFAQHDARLNQRITAIPAPTSLMVAVKERLLLAQAIGVETTRENLVYTVTSTEKAAAEKMLADRGLRGHRLVGLQLQSFPAKAYRDWPLDFFIALVKRLIETDASLRFIILGDAQSKKAAQVLQQTFPEHVQDTTGQLSLRANAALMSCLDLYIGVDTGPTHIAGALNIPMVAMYHARHPGEFLAPRQHPALVVLEHPSGTEDKTASMQEISVDRVYNAAISLLGKSLHA